MVLAVQARRFRSFPYCYSYSFSNTYCYSCYAFFYPVWWVCIGMAAMRREEPQRPHVL